MSREVILHNIDLTTTQGILTGGAKCMVELIKHLTKKYKNILYTGDSTRTAFIETLKLKGEKIEYISLGRYYFENSYYCYFINFFRTIFLALLNIPKFNENNVNIIITHSEILATVIFGFLMKLKNKDGLWVSFMHMSAPRLFSGYKGEYTNRKYFPTLGGLHIWLNQKIYNFLAQKADIIIITNPLYKENLSKKFSKVEVIHLGIELPMKQVDIIQDANPEIKEYEALFVGRVHITKGIFELLNIWEKAIKRNDKLKLAMVGSGLDKNNKELMKKIKKMGLENNIDLLGYKTGMEKERILQKSKIFLFPSLYESFGIVALEAMSHGLPVIAYNLPAFEIYVQNMIKVPVLDNEEFVEEFFKLLSDNLYYKRKSEEVKNYSMRFTWEETGKQFETIIDNILAEKTFGWTEKLRDPSTNMLPKKIIFIDSTLTGESMKAGIAGGEVRLAEIMRGFILKNWDVHFLTNGGGERFCNYFGLTNVTKHNFNVRECKNRWGFVIFTLKILFKLPKSLTRFDGYLYTANELLFDVIPALRIKLKNKNKWAASVHWMPPLKFWQRKKSNPFISLLFMIGERLSVFFIKHFANLALAVSESTKKQLLSVGLKADGVASVNCGVDLKKISNISLQNLDKKYDAVFMKRIQAVKGVFDLINIWRLVADKKPNAQLAIIGGGVDNKEINAEIKMKKLEKNIVFFGPIFDFDKKFEIISQTKMFILPSYEENWAIVMGEAMACNIPVLAYDLPELITVWQDGFEPIPLGNIQAFADKIIHYLDDKEVRTKQAALGYNYVQQFEWTTIAENEVKLVENL